MKIHDTVNPEGFYALIGNKEEFVALRNLLGIARGGKTSLSKTESHVLKQVADCIYTEIIEAEE